VFFDVYVLGLLLGDGCIMMLIMLLFCIVDFEFVIVFEVVLLGIELFCKIDVDYIFWYVNGGCGGVIVVNLVIVVLCDFGLDGMCLMMKFIF